MVAKSMTGFGRGETSHGGRVWIVELRCVNHRNLDVKIRVPRGYLEVEEKIRKIVSDKYQRGRVDLNLMVTGSEVEQVEIRTNTELAAKYKAALESMSDQLGMNKELDLRYLTSFPDVIEVSQKEEDFELIWPFIAEAVDKALDNCSIMRESEGGMLVEDLKSRLTSFHHTVNVIEAEIPQLVEQRELLLKERLRKLLDTAQLDPMRLAQEVAILADKSDVTEEVVRLKSHITQFSSFLEQDIPIGRKLDFLIQEFLREVNTLASKINDAAIAHLTVELKGELEKMREQVQNIE